ncbi:MAG: MarR family winged helix-turn-helix transcriptional regulator [Chitinophagales bacterium]
MGKFEEIANTLVIYKMKTSWLLIEKFYNEIATKNDASLSMAFVLMAINNEKGSTVTSIAPRIGMEPNSLSRILKNLIEKKYVYKKKSATDKRKVYICLTKEGVEMQKIALNKLFILENSIKSSLTEKDLDGFFKVMSTISTSIEALKNNNT